MDELLPELITVPERTRRLSEMMQKYLAGGISYDMLTSLVQDLFDPRRTSQVSPFDQRVATRPPVVSG